METISSKSRTLEFRGSHWSSKAGHPKNLLKRIDSELREAVLSMREENHAKTVSTRAAFFKKWLAKAKELKPAGQKLHSNMAPHLASILKGKRLLLWKEILVDLKYPDAAVIDEGIHGFSLTGWSKPTGVFRADVRPPNQTLDQLKGSACGLNSAVIGPLKVRNGISLMSRRCWKLKRKCAWAG